MKGKVSGKRGCCRIRDSFTWRYEGNRFRKSGIKRGMVHDPGEDMHTDMNNEGKGFRKSGTV